MDSHHNGLIMQRFDAYFVVSLKKMLHKKWRCNWFQKPWPPWPIFRVPTLSGKLREMAFPWKIREISGIICKAPQGILENRKMSGNSQGIWLLANLSTASEKCCIVSYIYILLHMLCPQSQNLHNVWKNIWAILITVGSPKFKVCCFLISLLFN